jgi:hypothetical protein
LSRLSSARLVSDTNNDLESPLCQLPRYFKPDAAVATRDERDPVVLFEARRGSSQS